MCIKQRITAAEVSPLEFISAIETEWNRSAYLSQSSASSSSTYRKIVKDLCTCQEVKCDCPLASFAESHDNVVENLSSNDHLPYHEAMEHIMKLFSNHRSPSGAASKNSKPQYEANVVSSSSGKKDKQKTKGSSTSSNSGDKGCNWYRKHLSGTASGHIWTQCKEPKAPRDRNVAETAALVQEVGNTTGTVSNLSRQFEAM
jgi:hypothetical protein